MHIRKVLITYICNYRHVDPSPDNVAASSLSDVMQRRNMRKVKVNAQVAFATWILETVGQVLIVVLWRLVNLDEHKEIGFTFAVILHYIILPYTLLMNSSHNKDLLIDDGVMNTFRNVFVALTQTRSISSQTGNENKCLEKCNRQNSKSVKQNAKNTKTGSYPSKNICQSYENNSSDIYIISRKMESHPDQKHDAYISINIPEGQPCPSVDLRVFNDNQKDKTFAGEIETEADDARKNLQRSYHLYLAEKILLNMMTNISDEKAYMHYLKLLAQLEDATISINAVSTEFQITPFIPDPYPKQGKIKTSNRQLRKLKNKMSLTKSKNVDMHTQDLENKFVGTFSKRLTKRKTTLENFKNYCLDEDSYKMFSQAIFDLEESLINRHTDS